MTEVLANLNPLIDGDVLAYSCGFAPGSEISVENALQATKTKIESLLAAFPGRSYHKLYLTGKGNFRDKVATILPYKGNRDPSHKPVFYEDIRQYMLDVYDGDLVEGREADDALGEEQWKSGKTTCLVGIDKDLDMIPGFHYNSKTHRVYYVNLQEANLNFLRQMLEGDRTDNIPGIRGIGKAKKFKHIPKGMHPNDACRVVAKFYHSQFKEDCYAAVREIATLLWIQRGGDADKQLDEFVRRIHEGFPAPF